mmetsp:Transcript_52931/g.123701  ORF Transcript_52931/g.123701 Transcript_52931/m.123701 type:complete len:347 (+) Transcript_52931:1-1041(+)
MQSKTTLIIVLSLVAQLILSLISGSVVFDSQNASDEHDPSWTPVSDLGTPSSPAWSALSAASAMLGLAAILGDDEVLTLGFVAVQAASISGSVWCYLSTIAPLRRLEESVPRDYMITGAVFILLAGLIGLVAFIVTFVTLGKSRKSKSPFSATPEVNVPIVQSDALAAAPHPALGSPTSELSDDGVQVTMAVETTTGYSGFPQYTGYAEPVRSPGRESVAVGSVSGGARWPSPTESERLEPHQRARLLVAESVVSDSGSVAASETGVGMSDLVFDPASGRFVRSGSAFPLWSVGSPSSRVGVADHVIDSASDHHTVQPTSPVSPSLGSRVSVQRDDGDTKTSFAVC